MKMAVVSGHGHDQRQRHGDDRARSGRRASVYSADAPSTKQTIPPIVSRPWLVTVELEHEQHDAQADQQQPRRC